MLPFPSLEAGATEEQGWWQGMGMVVLGGAIVPSCCRVAVCFQREVWTGPVDRSSIFSATEGSPHPMPHSRPAAPAVQLSPVASGGAETNEDLSPDS